MKIKDKLEQTEKVNIYFMGDLHYNHENVLKFDNRPFKNVSEMNNFLVNELKTKLTENDILFDLGDMFWKTEESIIRNFIDEIPTKNIYKILGNHDNENLFKYSLCNKFKALGDLFDVNIKYMEKNYSIVLSHFPILSWRGKAYGSINLHAHCHGNIDEFNNSSSDLRVDIGFNSELSKLNKSFLIPFNKIIDYFDKKVNKKDYRDWAKESNIIL